MKKWIRGSAVLGAAWLAVMAGSCGDAEKKGFNAPTGYTVKLPDAVSYTSTTTVRIIETVQILDTDSNPANGIEMQMVGGGCSILDKATNPDGGTISGSDVLAVQTQPYVVKSSSRGTYNIALDCPAPSGAVTSIDYSFAVDIGVNAATQTITVKLPS